MSVEVTVHLGVEERKEVTPEGWVEVDSYRPHSCPWDCNGRRHQMEVANVLQEANVEHVKLVTHHRRTSPLGTGPNGRVRFGDDMMPGVYRVAVPAIDEIWAVKALAAHRMEVNEWLAGNRPIPEACRV